MHWISSYIFVFLDLRARLLQLNRSEQRLDKSTLVSESSFYKLLDHRSCGRAKDSTHELVGCHSHELVGGMSLTLARTQTHKRVSLAGTQSAAMCGGHWDLQETTYMSSCSHRDKPWTGFAFFAYSHHLFPMVGPDRLGVQSSGNQAAGSAKAWRHRTCPPWKTELQRTSSWQPNIASCVYNPLLVAPPTW